MSLLAVGLAIMIVSEVATLAHVEPFWSWNTPIAWSGFIVFADSLVYRARGSSWIRSSPGEFVCLAFASIPLWLVFEFYNHFIENWYYVGLPENRALRLFGYAWSFATIWPAIFEGAELVAVWRNPRRGVPRPSNPPGSPALPALPGPPAAPALPALPARPALSVAFGAALLLWPLLWPSPYLAAPVWLGFIFMLDPINEWLGGESLFRDASAGRFDRFKNLLLSGFLCGVLWEFWNYWSRAKWHYTVPIMEQWKIFEMPLPGYLGFPPFALECFTMYVFVRSVAARSVGPFLRPSSLRPIGGAGMESGRLVGL
jgi:hypothetical protein